MHHPLEVMLVCVRGYAAYPLSLRHIEERIAERGVGVDHAPAPRWAIKILPVLAAVFRRRKRPVSTSWRMDEIDIKVAGQWKSLYRAVNRDGDTIDFLLRAKGNWEPRGAFWNQTPRATHAGVQDISLRSRAHCGHQDDAHDPQGSA